MGISNICCFDFICDCQWDGHFPLSSVLQIFWNCWKQQGWMVPAGRVFFQFLLPLSKPALVSVMIMLFLLNWNALFWPLAAVHSSDLEVVQVAVTTHVAQEETHWANLFSSALLLVYLLCCYSCFAEIFCEGISGTGLSRCFKCIKTIFNCRWNRFQKRFSFLVILSGLMDL